MRYVIVKLAAAGDVLLTTALARALRQARPEAGIAWLTSDYAAPLLQQNPDIDELWPVAAAHLGWSGAGRLTAWLRRRRRTDDVVLLAHRSRRLRWLLRVAGFRKIHAWVDGAAHATHHRLELQAELLRAAGVGFAQRALAPRLELTATERDQGERAWRGVAAPRWVLAPGGAANPWARMPNRRWPARRFLDLAGRIYEAGSTLRWVGGAEDAVLTTMLAELCHRPEDNLAGVSDLRSAAAVVAASDLVVGNDSIALVLAQALRKPGLGLYGPTDAALIHAPGQPWLQGRAGCGPCYDPRHGAWGRAYRCPRARCMEQIGTHQVWQLAQEAMHA